MKPPIVYEVTRPNPHRTMRRTAKVQSMVTSLSSPESSKQRAAVRIAVFVVPRARCLAIRADVARLRTRRRRPCRPRTRDRECRPPFVGEVLRLRSGTTLVGTRSMNAEKRIDRWREALSEQINEHPGPTVAIALGTGYLLAGAFLRGSLPVSWASECASVFASVGLASQSKASLRCVRASGREPILVPTVG